MSDVPIDPIGAARRLDTILGRADLPYTYTDSQGARLTIDGDLIYVAIDGIGSTGVDTPTGEDAVAMARAVLAAAGDTGHEVVSIEDYARAWDAAIEAAARSMRERAAQEVLFQSGTRAPMAISEAIDALPLLPDTTEDTDSTVHVATPEGITPCGRGTRDVTTSPLIPEVTCVGCLQALALEKGGQAIAMRDERDRLRTAWESARRGRAQARETAGMERFFASAAAADVIRLRKEVRAESARVSQARDERDQALRSAREVTGRLPEDDMVEPGDEVPDLAELHALVERLALDLSETGKAVTQRLAVVETHLGITDEDTEAPARYRDRDGDLWEETSPGHLFLSTRGMTGRPYAVVADEFGPLTPVTTVEPPAPCEVCGRAPDEQEHGPTGQCRHTPATRLGRPTT